VKGNAPAWTVRTYGDQTVYAASNPNAPAQNFGIVVAKSNNWPGAFTFFT